jgi:hypothetical protein
VVKDYSSAVTQGIALPAQGAWLRRAGGARVDECRRKLNTDPCVATEI